MPLRIRSHRVARSTALVIGGLLCIVGILHDAVNIPWLMRAIARGEISGRAGPQLVVNVALAGLALSLMGVFLILIAPDLGMGKRTAWRVGTVIGLFLVVFGVGAYIWLPIAHVLIFSVVGALICGPILWWRKDFRAE